MTRVTIGVDVGGTKVLAAVVGRAGRVKRTAHRTTPGRDATPQQLEDALTEAVREAAAGHEVAGVGLAAAGFIDAAGERVRFAPHLPWRDDPVRARLERRWRAPVLLENDATAAAFAEATLGAGAGYDDVLVVTLGTGLGGGIILGGRLHRGSQGMAGEFGHMRLVPGGLPCPCGGSGCWEQYCSGRALVRAAESRGLALDGPGVTEAALSGDPAALAAFAEVGASLGRGLAALVDAFDPACVVVGGGVSVAGELLLDPARRVLVEQVVGAGHRDVPPVVGAALGPEAGVIGAAALVRLESGRRVRAGRRTPTTRPRWMTIRARAVRGDTRAPAPPRDGRGRARRR